MKTSCITLATVSVLGAAFAAVSPPADVTASQAVVYWTTLATEAQRPLFCAWPAIARAATFRLKRGNVVKFTQTFSRAEGETNLEIVMPQIAEPLRFEDECVYTFELEFDRGGTRTANVASVRGVRDLGTRVIASAGNERAWQKVTHHALIPIIDDGVQTVTLNGDTASAGLDGLRGWYEWIGIPSGVNTFTAGGRTASFIGTRDTNCILLR